MFAVVRVGFLHPLSLYRSLKGCPSTVDVAISKAIDKVPPAVAVDLTEMWAG